MNELEEDFPVVTLTAREIECIRCAAKGFSSKEIGRQINAAPRTVERHLDQARLKLRARNRTHLVAEAINSGII